MYMYLTLSGVPGKPGPLKLISKSPNSVTVAWTAPADDGGRPLTGYLIQYSLFRMTGLSSYRIFLIFYMIDNQYISAPRAAID